MTEAEHLQANLLQAVAYGQELLAEVTAIRTERDQLVDAVSQLHATVRCLRQEGDDLREAVRVARLEGSRWEGIVAATRSQSEARRSPGPWEPPESDLSLALTLKVPFEVPRMCEVGTQCHPVPSEEEKVFERMLLLEVREDVRAVRRAMTEGGVSQSSSSSSPCVPRLDLTSVSSAPPPPSSALPSARFPLPLLPLSGVITSRSNPISLPGSPLRLPPPLAASEGGERWGRAQRLLALFRRVVWFFVFGAIWLFWVPSSMLFVHFPSFVFAYLFRSRVLTFASPKLLKSKIEKQVQKLKTCASLWSKDVHRF